MVDYLACKQKMSTKFKRLQIHKCECKKGVADKRLLKGRKHFSQSTMVSAAVPKLGKF